jgi:hypothetical protein
MFVVSHALRYPLVHLRPPLSSAPAEVLDPVPASVAVGAHREAAAPKKGSVLCPRRNGPLHAPSSSLDCARRAPLSKPTTTKRHTSLAMTPRSVTAPPRQPSRDSAAPQHGSRRPPSPAAGAPPHRPSPRPGRAPESNPWGVGTLSSPSPGRGRGQARRIPASSADHRAQGPHCKV